MAVQEASTKIDQDLLLKAWELMGKARTMSYVYEENKKLTSKYVHATSRGHEALQLALSLQLTPYDYVAPYYRDDSILLGMGFHPFDLMLQLMAKKDDPLSGGRTYYSHPSVNREDMPKVPHQSSATGMQIVPTTGVAQGIQYLENQGLDDKSLPERPVVACSFGDGAITEGEASEAMQMAVLKKLPILYFVQDNDWDISAHADEYRAMDASEFAQGFKGMEVLQTDGSDFFKSYETVRQALAIIRDERRPVLLHAKVPLLGHHTSGVRKEYYRSEDDLDTHGKRDPLPLFRQQLRDEGIEEETIKEVEEETDQLVRNSFEEAKQQEEPDPADLKNYIFAPTPITEEQGTRQPEGKEKAVMVDAALHAVDEILNQHPESLLYGQDVGGQLGGVFREAALLADKYGDQRVFNTPIQEAYIIGSTCGMSAAGCRPIVEVQFADYIWPGLNQLFTELSRSYYLSEGKWPVSSVIRVPTGAYGSGGPYHSGSDESVVAQIKGVKIAYPSTTADMKGLMKAAFYDPNPVVIFEHKGLYWSKVPGSEDAKTVEPDENYVLPMGKARKVIEASEDKRQEGDTMTVITWGMGVYWAKNAAKNFDDQVEIIDLRTLNPLDEEAVYESVGKHNKCMVITEETVTHSYAEALAGRITENCFEQLDAPPRIIGAENTPAIPLNEHYEQAMLPNAEKVAEGMKALLNY